MRSCNTVFYELGKRLNGVDPLLLPTVARAFGLGALTGLVGVEEAVFDHFAACLMDRGTTELRTRRSR